MRICKKCGQPIALELEKAIAEPRDEAWQMVWMSATSYDWVCDVDGNEHEPAERG